jgi:hypothetical protein
MPCVLGTQRVTSCTCASQVATRTCRRLDRSSLADEKSAATVNRPTAALVDKPLTGLPAQVSSSRSPPTRPSRHRR